MRVRLAQMFPGWTLEYIDSLSYLDINDIFAVTNAQQKLKAEAHEKAKAEAKRGRRR